MKLNGPPIDFDRLIPEWMERLHQYIGWNSRRITTVALTVIGGIVFACIFLSTAVLVVVQPRPTPTASLTPTLVPLPTSSVQTILAAFKKQGTVFKMQTDLKVPNADWQASQGTQFIVQPGAKPNTFLLLSYDSIQSAELDAFKASSSSQWKAWHVVQFVNILMLGDPGNDAGVEADTERNLAAVLVSPYRNSTLTPVATPPQ